MLTGTHTSGQRRLRRAIAGGALAAVVASLALALPTAAGYTDASNARSAAIPAHVEPPFHVGLSKQARMVDSGVGLGNDGNVYVWGRTDMGINGGAADAGVRRGPQRVPLPDGVTRQIAGGILNVNALTADGTVWGWGAYPARDGTDASKPNLNPKQIRIGTSWNGTGQILDRMLAISATEYAGAGIRDDGTVWHWGDNNGYGGNTGAGASQLPGLPDPGVAGNRPVFIKGAYTNFSVILENGNVYYWGGTGGSSLPTGTSVSSGRASKVTALAGWMRASTGADNPHIVAIDGGINMGAALLSNGQVLSWSRTNAGRTGRGAPISPAVIPNTPRITALQFGFTGVALIAEGAELWGYGAGDDYGHFPATPELIDTSVVQVASGQGYYLWQRADGSFWGRGYNPQGAIGMPTGTQRDSRQVSWDLGGLAQ